MSKTISIALANHLAQGSTTLAICWKATRRDGFILAVTTCARDLLFNGTLYLSADGFNPKAEAQEASAAVANTEIDGFLSDEITELDFQAGLWDGCTVEMFEVNYRDLSMGAMLHGVRTMGNINVGRAAFNAELRGLTQSLQKTIGELWTNTCPAGFGDNRCKKDVEALRVTGTFTSVTDLRTMRDSARTEADDYFGAGVITITSGEADGEQMEVYSYTADGTFVLHLPMEFNVAVGDTYSVIPGCRKRFDEDCRAKWGNGVNFRGAPHVPGNNNIIGLGTTGSTS